MKKAMWKTSVFPVTVSLKITQTCSFLMNLQLEKLINVSRSAWKVVTPSIYYRHGIKEEQKQFCRSTSRSFNGHNKLRALKSNFLMGCTLQTEINRIIVRSKFAITCHNCINLLLCISTDYNMVSIFYDYLV